MYVKPLGHLALILCKMSHQLSQLKAPKRTQGWDILSQRDSQQNFMSADKDVVGIRVTFTSSLQQINVIPYSHPELTAWHTDPIRVVTWNVCMKYVHTEGQFYRITGFSNSTLCQQVSLTQDKNITLAQRACHSEQINLFHFLTTCKISLYIDWSVFLCTASLFLLEHKNKANFFFHMVNVFSLNIFSMWKH